MTKPIELPAPAEPLRYVCNKCGSVGLGAGAAHQRSDGEQCAYMGVPYGPFWTAEQVRACAAAAIAAQAAEMEALRAVAKFAAEHLSSDWPERCQEIVRAARAALKERAPNAELSGPQRPARKDEDGTE